MFRRGTIGLTCRLTRKICRFLQFADHCYRRGAFIIFSVITERCSLTAPYTNAARVITRRRLSPDKMGRSRAASDSETRRPNMTRLCFLPHSVLLLLLFLYMCSVISPLHLLLHSFLLPLVSSPLPHHLWQQLCLRLGIFKPSNSHRR